MRGVGGPKRDLCKNRDDACQGLIYPPVLSTKTTDTTKGGRWIDFLKGLRDPKLSCDAQHALGAAAARSNRIHFKRQAKQSHAGPLKE